MLIIFLFVDVKAEVENVIKMGRKLVDSAEVAEESQKGILTEKIDSLKEEFNVTGKNVSEVQSNLESSLTMMKKFESISEALDRWTHSSASELSSIEKETPDMEKFRNIISDLYLDMIKYKRSFLDLYKIYEDISSLNTPEVLVDDLKSRIGKLETQWHSMNDKLQQQYDNYQSKSRGESKDAKETKAQLESR